MVAALKGPFIAARGFSNGRNNGSVKWLVVHTAEGSRTVQALGNYFAGTRAGSSNAGVDDAGYAQYVSYGNTPWTNPPINSTSDTLELCGFRSWNRDTWLQHRGMLDNTAKWIAWRAAVRGIPIRLITGAQAVAGVKGVLDHQRVNDGFHKSSHTDVGPGFPWDYVIHKAQQVAGLLPADQIDVPTTAQGDRILGLYNPPLRDLPGNHDVSGVQNVLRMLGNNIVIDGIYDLETANIVNVFKEHRGIHETGCGEKTWAALRAVVHG